MVDLVTILGPGIGFVSAVIGAFGLRNSYKGAETANFEWEFSVSKEEGLLEIKNKGIDKAKSVFISATLDGEIRDKVSKRTHEFNEAIKFHIDWDSKKQIGLLEVEQLDAFMDYPEKLRKWYIDREKTIKEIARKKQEQEEKEREQRRKEHPEYAVLDNIVKAGGFNFGATFGDFGVSELLKKPIMPEEIYENTFLMVGQNTLSLDGYVIATKKKGWNRQHRQDVSQTIADVSNQMDDIYKRFKNTFDR